MNVAPIGKTEEADVLLIVNGPGHDGLAAPIAIAIELIGLGTPNNNVDPAPVTVAFALAPPIVFAVPDTVKLRVPVPSANVPPVNVRLRTEIVVTGLPVPRFNVPADNEKLPSDATPTGNVVVPPVTVMPPSVTVPVPVTVTVPPETVNVPKATLPVVIADASSALVLALAELIVTEPVTVKEASFTDEILIALRPVFEIEPTITFVPDVAAPNKMSAPATVRELERAPVIVTFSIPN